MALFLPRPALSYYPACRESRLRGRRSLARPAAASLSPSFSLDDSAGVAAAAAVAATALTAVAVGRRGSSQGTAEVDDKAVVKEYFEGVGFGRWRRIYSDSDDVNAVQRDIRDGHALTVETVLTMLRDGGDELRGVSVCDVGCGTGSLAIPLAKAGAVVTACDISAAMVAEAELRAAAAGPWTDGTEPPRFQTGDLEDLSASASAVYEPERPFEAVACVDVLIHYPQSRAEAMVRKLAGLARRRLVLSFAPRTPVLAALKLVGSLFPGASKATRAYLHSEDEVRAALRDAGWDVSSRKMISTRFYFSTVLEAVPAASASA